MGTQHIRREPTVEERLANCEALMRVLVLKLGNNVEISPLEMAIEMMHPHKHSLMVRPSDGTFIARVET